MSEPIILYAKPVVANRRAALTEKTTALVKKLKRKPKLVVVLVGNNPASEIYVSKKEYRAVQVGFESATLRFDESVEPALVKQEIDKLNLDRAVDGILIQRPLPNQFIESTVSGWVSPEKDVDCLHPENVGLLLSGRPRFLPCTPGGILLLLEHYGLSVKGKLACVVGRSSIVGKPLAALLLSKDASVIQLHRQTKCPESLARLADFLFVATGSAGLVNQSWIKPGAVVIDVGIHRLPDGKIIGDVSGDATKNGPSAISPVPGGVGPLTIQVLLENTFASAERRG